MTCQLPSPLNIDLRSVRGDDEQHHDDYEDESISDVSDPNS